MDTLDVLSKFGIELEGQRFRKGGEEIMSICPFHAGPRPSFSLNVERGIFNCFSCGAKGRIYDIIAEYTTLTAQEAQEACQDSLPKFAYTDTHRKKKPTKTRSRYLTPPEIDMLTAYADGLHALLIDGAVKFQRYLTEGRGLSWEAIEHFRLGAAQAIEDYNQHYTKTQAERFSIYGRAWMEFLSNVRLVNSKGGDYWWKPAVILPYSYGGQVYYCNARLLPGHDTDFRYQGMSGIVRETFFHEDALDEFDSLYVVEGEFNCIKMWDVGIRNVVSFGGKQQFSDSLISRLYGRDVVLYFDTDESDPDFEKRTEAVQKLLNSARSVAYFELPLGVDPNDYLNSHSRAEFEAEVLSNVVSVPSEDEFCPGEYRVIPESDREQVISLSEAQKMTSQFMGNVAADFPAYAGKRVLINTPVGTGKSTAAVNLINSRNHDRALVLTSTHYSATDYDDLLDFQTFTLHLKGRAHPDVECEYADKAELYASRGYSLLFRMKFCYGVCGQARTLEQGKKRAQEEDEPEYADVGCLYLRQLEAARTAGTLIATHAHGQLKNFLINPYYGNDRRNLVVIDEEASLVQNVHFSRTALRDNLNLFTGIAQALTEKGTTEPGAAAIDLSNMLNDMEGARLERTGYDPDLEPFTAQAVYELDKAIARAVKGNGFLHRPCKLHDLVYAVNNGLPFDYDHERDALFYTWRPVFPDKACVVFMSATTPRAYLENILNIQLDQVVGEQYHVRRDKLEVIQLLNVAGGRGRLLRDEIRQESVKTFFELALEKHREGRILVITSQGANISQDEDDTAKTRIISMLQPIAQAGGRRLVAVGTSDLEAGNVPASRSDIPVIHYGIRGTNVFADYDILIELNAHYYHAQAIIDGVRTSFGVDISDDKPVKKTVPFRMLDREYNVERYVHEDERVRLYIQATQEADIQQTEGRILRGQDTPKIVYRLHNVNVRPYPDRVYRSWASMLRAEFGYAEITGKMAEVLDWIQGEVKVGQEFTTKQVCEEAGGYVDNTNRRYMARLKELGYVENVAQGKGIQTRWRRLK